MKSLLLVLVLGVAFVSAEQKDILTDTFITSFLDQISSGISNLLANNFIQSLISLFSIGKRQIIIDTFLDQFISSITSGLQNLLSNQLLSGLISLFGKRQLILDTFLDQFINLLTGGFQNLLSNQLLSGLISLFGKRSLDIESIINQVQYLVGQYANQLVSTIGQYANNLLGLIQSIFNHNGRHTRVNFMHLLATLEEEIRNLTQNLFGNIITVINQMLGNSKQSLDLLATIQQLLGNYSGDLLTVISNISSSLLQYASQFENIYNIIVQALHSLNLDLGSLSGLINLFNPTLLNNLLG